MIHHGAMRALILIACGLSLGGCVVGTVARTAVAVVTLPVKVAGAAVDAATTSQAEADRNAGRKLREEEERAGRAARLREQQCAKAVKRGEQCPPPPTQPSPSPSVR
ncbi:MAG: hypothetical protein ABIR63_03835 [Sphingomicrobium sp.]